jgi:hypothetical protein
MVYRRNGLVVNVVVEKNKTWGTVKHGNYVVRIWKNDLGKGNAELKARIYGTFDDFQTRSFDEEELGELQEGIRKTLKMMRKHRVRQLWKRFFFPW